MKKATIIVTAYNAEATINRSLESVLKSVYKHDLEVIVIDDCSEDNTYSVLKKLEKNCDNLTVLQTETNSGGPSIPRNIGIENAKGKYITFLDDDDYIDCEKFMQLVEYANEKDIDFLKSSIMLLKYDSVEKIEVLDRKQFDNRSNKERIEVILSNLSTRIDCLLKTKFLKNNDVRFPIEYKIGEDTLFYALLFSKNPTVDYFDNAHYYYNTINSNIQELSTTQSYSNKELNQHLDVWEKTHEILLQSGINYYALRLSTAIRNTLIALVKLSRNTINRPTFERFSQLVRRNKKYLFGKMNLVNRYQEIFNTLIKDDYISFQEATKHRILINGYDLKFIKPIEKYLSKDFNIRFDEWTGHNTHDDGKSREMLKWADTIWCEWMLGNSVWYSKHKANYQALIIRAHRFELFREFGHQVDFQKVNAVISVGYYYLSKFSEQFSIPRGKMKLVSNYVEDSIYAGIKNEGYKKHIALCGILPKRKGFFKGIKLIESLKKEDPKFKLYIIGDRPYDIDWIQKNPQEKTYYDKCYKYIKEHNLADSIIFTGRMERQNMFKDVGYVLSLSDHDQPESFHLTPAEAIADNTIALLLDWPGVEYVYPDYIIKNSVERMRETILATVNDDMQYNKILEDSKEFVFNNYSINRYLKEINKLINIILINL